MGDADYMFPSQLEFEAVTLLKTLAKSQDHMDYCEMCRRVDDHDDDCLILKAKEFIKRWNLG